jgi:hypothetical protein
MWMRKFSLALFLGAAMALMGCGSSDSSSEGSGGTAGSGGAPGGGGAGGAIEPSFQELYDQGLTRYVDEFDPIEPVQKQDGMTTYTFEVPSDPLAEPRGPLCLRGAGFNLQTREGTSDELVIFLQGGGACWDTFCEANTEAGAMPAPGSNAGILDPLFPNNPVADWDVAYLPYCDGSLFAGDVDRILPQSIFDGGEPSQGYQRGLQNLTAALDVTVEVFPSPTRILLTGVSAGAFGTLTALPLVRFYYPDTEIVLFNDSGVGVGNGDDPSFINETLIDGWNARGIVPESCPECTSNGHATRLIEWQLSADDNFTMSALSYSEDGVVADFFFGVDGEVFREQLLEETTRTAEAFPETYKRFIPVGREHTALLAETSSMVGLFAIGGLDETLDGSSVLDFLTAQLDGSETWRDLVDESLLTP